jgi:nucleoside-diphosphate-sugar epimerase
LWSYVDSRDVARACRLGLEAAPLGAEHCIVAAGDTVMGRPSQDLMAECFSGVKIARALGEFESLQSTDKARRLFGYVPRHSWRG